MYKAVKKLFQKETGLQSCYTKESEYHSKLEPDGCFPKTSAANFALTTYMFITR